MLMDIQMWEYKLSFLMDGHLPLSVDGLDLLPKNELFHMY